MGERNCTLGHRVHVASELERFEIFQKSRFKKRSAVVSCHHGQKLQISFGKVIGIEKINRRSQARGDRKTRLKRRLPKEQVKHRLPVRAPGFPIAVGHRELVKIGQERSTVPIVSFNTILHIVLLLHYQIGFDNNIFDSSRSCPVKSNCQTQKKLENGFTAHLLRCNIGSELQTLSSKTEFQPEQIGLQVGLGWGSMPRNCESTLRRTKHFDLTEIFPTVTRIVPCSSCAFAFNRRHH